MSCVQSRALERVLFSGQLRGSKVQPKRLTDDTATARHMDAGPSKGHNPLKQANYKQCTHGYLQIYNTHLLYVFVMYLFIYLYVPYDKCRI